MSSTQPLADRAEAIYRELKSMRRRFQIGSWVTLIVGGLLLALVAVYFSIGYSEISDLRDPDLIVSFVGQTVDDQIPIVRQRIESEINNNAATWAEQASQQVVDGIPTLREHIEQLALQQSDTVIAKIDVVGEQQFRRLLDENRSTMQKAIEDLKNDEDVSEEVLLALQQAIEKELQIGGAEQADAVLTIVSSMNKNMAEILAGEDLTREQMAERRVLMLAKRFQVEQFGDAKIDLSLPVVSEIVGDLEQKKMRREASKAAAESNDAPAVKPAETKKPVVKPAEKKPAEEPKEAAKTPDKPAEKPAEKKDVPAEKKPAEEPKEAAKTPDKPAEKPAEKEDVPAEKKPAEK